MLVLAPARTLKYLLDAEMCSTKYQPTSLTSLAVTQKLIVQRGCRLHQAICKVGWKKWADDARSHMLACKTTDFGSKIAYTVKTHKADGEVSARLIHASTGHALLGYSAIIDKIVQKGERVTPHLQQH